MACTCDYSFICNECAERMEVQNKLDYDNERIEWVIAAIEALAAKLELPIEPRPAKRNV